QSGKRTFTRKNSGLTACPRGLAGKVRSGPTFALWPLQPSIDKPPHKVASRISTTIRCNRNVRKVDACALVDLKRLLLHLATGNGRPLALPCWRGESMPSCWRGSFVRHGVCARKVFPTGAREEAPP